jgi:three-Cys-motif partner protein
LETCTLGGKRGSNGKCSLPAPDDGLVVQCVGEWAKDKHDYLGRYIAATRYVRRKYLPPMGNGGAAFIDLFGGPGRCCIRGTTPERIDGSPLIALRHDEAPFTKVIVCDLDHESVVALRQRTAEFGERARIIEGDCNLVIDEIVRAIPVDGLNIALIDPFAARALNFDATISRLAGFKRMDLIIHWPTMDLKRNLGRNQDVLNDMLGLHDDRARAFTPEDVTRKIGTLKDQLKPFGYDVHQEDRSVPVKNSKHGILYHLVFASKDKQGNKIWNSIARREPSGQGSLF